MPTLNRPLTAQKILQIAKKGVKRILLKPPPQPDAPENPDPNKFPTWIVSGVTIADSLQQNGGIIYDMGIAARYLHTWKTHFQELPQRTLEIGSGHTMGVSVCLCMSGVKEAWALEPFAPLQFDLNDFLRGYVTLRAACQSLNTLEDNPQIDAGSKREVSLTPPQTETIEDGRYLLGEAEARRFTSHAVEATGFDSGTFDYVFSHACMEHVQCPEKCVREIYRLLRPGGITAHQIDLRDHRDFDEPLAFLCEPENRWSWDEAFKKRYFKPDGTVFTNRLRASHWLSILEETGFEILQSDANQIMNDNAFSKIQSDLIPQFKCLPENDLKTLGWFIVARKP